MLRKEDGDRLVGEETRQGEFFGVIVTRKCIIVLRISWHDGMLFSLRGVELPDEEILSGFLAQYYDDTHLVDVIPDEILLPVPPDLVEGGEEWLTERRGKRVALRLPRRSS